MPQLVLALVLLLVPASAISSPLDASLTTPEDIRAAGQEIREILYWEKKDLRNWVTLAKHLLATSQRGFESGGANRREYGARVVGISYDIASFTWVGWDEDGVEITADLREVGVEAARLNVRFGEQNEVPIQVKSRGYWILGAHLVVEKEYDSAIETWRKALEFSDEDGVREIRGWIVMAEALKSGTDRELTPVLQELESAGGHFGETASQIKRAYRVFNGA